MRETLSKFPDFKSQMTILEEVVHSRGHICLFFPKYHCELNPIERNWSHAKRVARQYVNGSIVKLRQVVPSSLDSVTDKMMNKDMAYRSGCKGKEVEATVKLYKSHRRVYNTDK